MKKKLRDSSGLTLVEMLCAIPILIMLCVLANTGLNMAMDNLRERTAGSETQLLLSSLSNALTDKLRYCVVTDKTPTAPAGTPHTYDLSIGNVDLTADGKVIVIDNDGAEKKLLYDGAYGTDGAYGADTRYKVEEVKVDTAVTDDIPIFTVTLKVQGASAATGHVKAETTLTVRCLNPIKEEVLPP